MTPIRHHAVPEASDAEYAIARGIDPLPFRRLLPTEPTAPDDRGRRRMAVRKARRVIEELRLAGLRIEAGR